MNNDTSTFFTTTIWEDIKHDPQWIRCDVVYQDGEIKHAQSSEYDEEKNSESVYTKTQYQRH